ncbi:zinc finger protein ZFP2-like [Engraulis encrasicolus]|uniref:zinc finger protein ZFP2-like n=1 Tax=Engraulis encrasicolus TaxID=184585 RepID=UPI002FD6F73F
MDLECNSLLFKSRLQEDEANLQQLLEYEEQVCQCQTLRLQVEDLQKRLVEKDNKLTESNKVIRALRDEVQTLKQQLEQHIRKYRDDDAIGQRCQQGRRARVNHITASGCEIPPNVFLSCTSGDDPTDTPTSPQEPEDDSADFPASPAAEDDDALTSPRQLKMPVLSVKLQDCREMLGPDGVFNIQPMEVLSDEDDEDDGGYKGYQDDDDSDFDPTDPTFDEPAPAREQKRQNRGVERVNEAKPEKYHYDKRYTCTECGKTFEFQSWLAQHQRSRTCKKKSITDTNAATCENASTESTHESASTDSPNAESQPEKGSDAKSQKPSFECDVCGKILTAKTSLKVHKRRHTGEMPYACKVCDKTFRQLGGLIKHQHHHPQLMGEKTGEKPIKTAEKPVKTSAKVIKEKKKCSLCPKEFPSSSRLQRHFRIHSRENKKDVVHKCSLCPKEFPSSARLKRHFTIHSGEKPYLCSQCPKTFASSSYLKIHEALHTDEKPFECLVCKMTFKTKLGLKCHESMHSGLKPFACTYCNKTFRLNKALKIHIRRHVGEKPYKCSRCDASFVNSSSLKEHLRRHTGERPYCCSICGKSFSYAHILRTHQIVHTGEKRHQCTVCGEKFSYLQPLYDHERRVHNIVSYPCQECGKNFKSDRGLKGHGCFQGQNSAQVNNDKGVEAVKCIEGIEAAKCIEEVEAATYIDLM